MTETYVEVRLALGWHTKEIADDTGLPFEVIHGWRRSMIRRWGSVERAACARCPDGRPTPMWVAKLRPSDVAFLKSYATGVPGTPNLAGQKAWSRILQISGHRGRIEALADLAFCGFFGR